MHLQNHLTLPLDWGILHVSRRASAWFSTQTPHFSKFSKLPSLPWFQPGDVHSASRASGSLWTHHEDFGSSNMFQPSTKPKPHQAASSRIKPHQAASSRQVVQHHEPPWEILLLSTVVTQIAQWAMKRVSGMKSRPGKMLTCR